jgi:hypothetical protein
MHALFVHGMGRSPLSGWSLARRLRHAGIPTHTFGYSVALEDFARIRRRLTARIETLAERGDYVLIGHSLGGILIRGAVQALRPDSRPPHHVFLLGSPVRAVRVAQRLGRNVVYRALTRDCGQLLASPARMGEIGAPGVPTTCIAGVRGLPLKRGPFGGEPNDGLVSLSEVRADWTADPIQLPVVHTLLPSSAAVAAVILERLGRDRQRA